MPKQNYGQKGLSEKPNTNAEGSVDEATDPVDAGAIAPGNVEALRAEEAPNNEIATERPKDSQ